MEEAERDRNNLLNEHMLKE